MHVIPPSTCRVPDTYLRVMPPKAQPPAAPPLPPVNRGASADTVQPSPFADELHTAAMGGKSPRGGRDKHSRGSSRGPFVHGLFKPRWQSGQKASPPDASPKKSRKNPAYKAGADVLQLPALRNALVLPSGVSYWFPKGNEPSRGGAGVAPKPHLPSHRSKVELQLLSKA